MSTTQKTAYRRAWEFFYAHAGYSVAQGETKRQGRARSARRLAKAETKAKQMGYTFDWADDPDGCIGCDCGNDECACYTGEPHECLYCVMRDSDGAVVQSLGSICEPSREYRRVIEAELALEQLG